jgi:LacI family transcriptional regulator
MRRDDSAGHICENCAYRGSGGRHGEAQGLSERRRELFRKSTISDVAALAGVSIKTVSRVLNREPKVRPATRERVEAAMQELRYRPNSPGRMLASRRSYILGLVYNANSSYITSIQNGALDACRQQHYDLLIHPCHYRDPAITEEIAELVTSAKVDGLLLTPPVSDLVSVRTLMSELQVPLVSISQGSIAQGSISQGSASADDWAVGTNDREVSAELTAYLVRLGHRRIAFVKSHPDHKAMTNRFRGFRDGMQAAGLGIESRWAVQGENTFESGRRAGEQLLDSGVRPTAIFCANDHMAAGVMAVAHERGLAIPRELSVAGFDDIPLASQIWPALTTVRQPLREMAGLAAELLIQRLRNRPGDKLARVVEATLVLRASTGPAPP